MGNLKKGLIKVLGTYFILGGVICITDFLFKMGVLGFVSTLFPSLLTISVMLFFIYTGYLGLFRTEYVYTKKFLNIALVIQIFQFSLIGVVFKNYFGPYLGLGITDTPSLEFLFSFRSFTYLFANGYKHDTNEISLMINLLPLAYLIVVNNLDKLEYS